MVAQEIRKVTQKESQQNKKERLTEAKRHAPKTKQVFDADKCRKLLIQSDSSYQYVFQHDSGAIQSLEEKYYLSPALSRTESMEEFVFRYLGETER